METLKTGMVARFDAFRSGLVPVRVISIVGQSGPCSTAQTVTARVTRNHGAYRAGEIITCFALHVIPVRALRGRRYHTAILPYRVACDASRSNLT